MKRRVVVTGLGLVTPIGNNVADSWANVIEGRSGIASVTRFDAEKYGSRIAGEVKGFDPKAVIAPKELKKMDLFIQFGLVASVEAVADAGLEEADLNKERIGVSIGSGIGGLPGIEAEGDALLAGGPRKVSPFFIPRCIVNMVAGHVSIRFGYKGPNLAGATACTTGTHALGEAARLIQYGDADVMVAGGAEGSTSPLGLAGFSAARALSTRNDAPEKASRPWDKDRDGFVLAEGAGVMVLEEYEHAKARGARIYAEVTGFGMSADAYHITQPTPDGNGAARSMQAAIKDAGLAVQDISYINAHGTSTPIGDAVEVKAVRSVFGDHAERLAVSSTKSMTGHMLGAAGGAEAVFTVLSIYHGIIPPTVNLDEAGEGCDLDFVPHRARKATIEAALSNSFGFGGTNGTLVFTRV